MVRNGRNKISTIDQNHRKPMDFSTETYLAELKRFGLTGRLWLDNDDIPDDVELPASWRALLRGSVQERDRHLDAMWSPMIARLPSVAKFLRQKVRRPAVLQKDSGDVCLLYPYTVDLDDLNFFIGQAPLQANMANDTLWRALPNDLRAFYQNIHNGWTFFPAMSMGPLPVQNQTSLTARLDLTPKEVTALGINPDLIWCVFHNGSGDSLCLDLENDAVESHPAGFIWWHETPTKLEPVDFWSTLDRWFGAFVEEADSH